MPSAHSPIQITDPVRDATCGRYQELHTWPTHRGASSPWDWSLRFPLPSNKMTLIINSRQSQLSGLAIRCTISLWLPYSTKVLVKTNQTSKLDRRLITEFLWPPSSSIIRLWLPYRVLGIKRAQTRWGCVVQLRSSYHLPAPSSDSGYHIAPKFSARRIKRAQTRWGCVTPPSSSIIRLWLPYSTKVLVKTNQTSPNSMGCVVNYGVPMATFQLHHQTLVTI
ncbi:hypothetical protein EVAR_18243_1 [Eumeta japonica]|uniref:Uncharacterized protein n=1 Tax=Eumeta variegata TaxID=151549 RepID=A0A4C1UKW4_EUMVA|nr:hypothetical protein EVAR_18243_1 [Eumeta japonica]